MTNRKCYGPEATSATCPTNALENGGAGSIAEQLLDVRADVTLGGGAATFEETATAGAYEGMTLWEQAEARGYQTVTTAEELSAVTEADAESPVLGLFTSGNFPTRYAAAYATDGGASGDAVTCEANSERLDEDLSLANLTEKAISLLDNEEGFFLQVEGASIDKRDHAADACGQIGETADLDEAVQAALEFAEADGETLVIVTADHAHTSQIVSSDTPGLTIKLLTADGDPMIVSYATAEAGSSQQHTGTQLRIAAYGPGAANVVGLTDQTDTFFTIANSLNLTRDLNALSADAALTLTDTEVPDSADAAASLTGLNGDWVADVSIDGTSVGQVDVLHGSATYSLETGLALGEHTVTLSGRQTGTTVSTVLTVSETAVVDEPVSSSAAAAAIGGNDAGTGAGSVLQNSSASLVATGAIVGVLLMVAGVILVLARRRRLGLGR